MNVLSFSAVCLFAVVVSLDIEPNNVGTLNPEIISTDVSSEHSSEAPNSAVDPVGNVEQIAEEENPSTEGIFHHDEPKEPHIIIKKFALPNLDFKTPPRNIWPSGWHNKINNTLHFSSGQQNYLNAVENINDDKTVGQIKTNSIYTIHHPNKIYKNVNPAASDFYQRLFLSPLKNKNLKQHFSDINKLETKLNSGDIHDSGRIIPYESTLLHRINKSKEIHKIAQPFVITGPSYNVDLSKSKKLYMQLSGGSKDIHVSKEELGTDEHIKDAEYSNVTAKIIQENLPIDIGDEQLEKIETDEINSQSLDNFEEQEVRVKQSTEFTPLALAGVKPLNMQHNEFVQPNWIDVTDNLPQNSIYNNKLILPNNSELEQIATISKLTATSKSLLPTANTPPEFIAKLHNNKNYIESDHNTIGKSLWLYEPDEVVKTKILAERPPKFITQLPGDRDKVKANTVPYILIAYPKLEKPIFKDHISILQSFLLSVKKELKMTAQSDKIIINTIFRHITFIINDLNTQGTSSYVIGYLSDLLIQTVLEDITMESIRKSIDTAQRRKLNLQNVITKKIMFKGNVLFRKC